MDEERRIDEVDTDKHPIAKIVQYLTICVQGSTHSSILRGRLSVSTSKQRTPSILHWF